MIAPDELPVWFVIPASVALCIVWRRQAVRARRPTNHNEQEQR